MTHPREGKRESTRTARGARRTTIKIKIIDHTAMNIAMHMGLKIIDHTAMNIAMHMGLKQP